MSKLVIFFRTYMLIFPSLFIFMGCKANHSSLDQFYLNAKNQDETSSFITNVDPSNHINTLRETAFARHYIHKGGFSPFLHSSLKKEQNYVQEQSLGGLKIKGVVKKEGKIFVLVETAGKNILILKK